MVEAGGIEPLRAGSAGVLRIGHAARIGGLSATQAGLRQGVTSSGGDDEGTDADAGPQHPGRPTCVTSAQPEHNLSITDAAVWRLAGQADAVAMMLIGAALGA